jgi:NAD(P)-dependent dehydrogenase (short-subunit alcohol dehydrogenase family)
MHRLQGQTVVVLGGTAGIGLETARQARDDGAEVIITARNAEHLRATGTALGVRTAALDVTDLDRLARFFDARAVDHVLLTGTDAHVLLPLEIARQAVGRVNGTLLIVGGTSGRATAPERSVATAMPALTRQLAVALAPIRVNLIAAGFVDTALAAPIVAAHREHLRRTLPIRRVVRPADIAALALQLMANTAITGGTFDVDGGQQLVAR